MKTSVLWLMLCLTGSALAQVPSPPRACELSFASTNWWPLYRGFTGEGTVRCRDGQSMRVHVVGQGHELSVDRWKIAHGSGRYSQVTRMEDTLGHFVRTRDGSRLVKDAGAAVPEDARPHLALAGRGNGFEVDDAIEDLRIERAGP